MKVMFFASLRERLNCDTEQWDDISGIETAEDVLQQLIQRGAPWSEALQSGRLLVAVNQEMCSLDTPVNANDEVAFFPPVTGG